MRRWTGLALVAIGAILLLAVNVPLTFVSLRLTGLVLLITGLAGLRVPQWAYHWLRGHQDELKDALDRLTEPPSEGSPDSPRVSLGDLLRPEPTTETPASRRGLRAGARLGRVFGPRADNGPVPGPVVPLSVVKNRQCPVYLRFV